MLNVKQGSCEKEYKPFWYDLTRDKNPGLPPITRTINYIKTANHWINN